MVQVAYSEKEVKKILAIRCEEEDVEMDEDALILLTKYVWFKFSSRLFFCVCPPPFCTVMSLFCANPASYKFCFLSQPMCVEQNIWCLLRSIPLTRFAFNLFFFGPQAHNVDMHRERSHDEGVKVWHPLLVLFEIREQ